MSEDMFGAKCTTGFMVGMKVFERDGEMHFEVEDTWLYEGATVRLSPADTDRLLAWLCERRGMVAVPTELAAELRDRCEVYEACMTCDLAADCATLREALSEQAGEREVEE